MIYLCATAGNSGFGTRTFPGPAVYEVTNDEPALSWVHGSGRGNRQLFLIEADGDQQPVITTLPAGPLRSLREWKPRVIVPPGGRVLLAADEDAIILPPQEPLPAGAEPGEPSYQYACPSCDRTWPGEAILARHREAEHP